MSHYALVSRSEPLVVEQDDEEESSSRKGSSYQQELVTIFQSYAELYPNTRLAEEFRERDQLLTQAAAIQARRKQGAASDESASQKKSGIGRFFRFWSKREDTAQTAKEDPALLEENFLIFSENDENESDVALCGTQGQLDSSCIPQEAHSAARFHLASSRTQRNRPILVRKATGFPSAPSKAIVIIGVGKIAEFLENPTNGREQTSDPEPLLSLVKQTSDREDLLSYISSMETPHDLSHVRATSLGPNFIAVSWGFMDGIVVMYRRMSIPSVPEVGWESVAMFGPTRATLNTLGQSGDLFAEVSNGLFLSSLLRVTDVVPFVGEYPSDETASQPLPAATLAVSRLGGFMELLPLTPRLWYGPVLTPENHKYKPRPTRKRKRRSNEPPEHYSVGKLFNLTQDDRAIASLTSSEHHDDIICMDAYRVQSSTATTPMYVLAACGTRKGRENISFWGVQTIFDTAGGIPSGFSLRVSLIDKINIGPVGGDVTIFATEEIWNKWRKPRRVRLRRLDPDEGEGPAKAQAVNVDSLGNNQSTRSHRTGTLSTPAPICCLRFGPLAPSIGEDESTQTESKLMIAALDWNGGVTIVDCHGVCQAALQQRQQNETHRRSRPEDSVFGLCSISLHRNQSLELSLKARNMQNNTVDVRWWRPAGTDKSLSRFCLAMVSTAGQLQVLDLSAPVTSADKLSCALDLSSMLDDSFSITIVDITESDSLSFLLDQYRQSGKGGQDLLLEGSNNELSLCEMQKLDAGVIVQSLAQSGRYNEAVAAVETLDARQQVELASVVDSCRRHLWEKEGDVTHLDKITDDVYVTNQAIAIFKEDSIATRNLDVENARKAAMIAIKRTKVAKREKTSLGAMNGEPVETGAATMEQLTDTLAVLENAVVTLCTYTILSRNFGKKLSFERFKSGFLQMSLAEIAASFAKKGDIAAVTLLFIRHKKDVMPSRLEVLDQIPVTVNVSSYCHLLPVCLPPGESEDFFVPLDDSDGQLPWSHMAKYHGIRSGVNAFIDLEDRETAFEFSKSERKNLEPNGVGDERDTIERWYLKRAQHVQNSLGDLSAVIEFCDFALRRLPDYASDGTSLSVEATMSSSLRSIHALRACAYHLNQMLNDGVLLSTERQLSFATSMIMGTEELRKMSLPELVFMILGETSDSLDLFSKYKTFLRPLVNIAGFDGGESKNGDESPSVGMDAAIAAYCRKLVSNAVISSSDASVSGSIASSKVGVFRDALATCVTITNASRTTIRKGDRIIRDKEVLGELVLSVFDETAQSLRDVSIAAPDCIYIIDMLWEMYECLPKHVPMSEASAESFAAMQERTDGLYCQLVALDLSSQWVQSRAFSLVTAMRSSLNVNEKDDDVECYTGKRTLQEDSVGLNIVSEMCRGFCHLVGKRQESTPKQAQLSLLRDLFDDVSELDRICFRSLLPFENVFQTQLIRQLLEEEHFDLLAEMLTSNGEDWIDKKKLQTAVSSYVKEAMFDGSDGERIDGNKVQAAIPGAIQCQDILGPFFPELHSEFQSMRRYLDAASFIGNVLYFGQENSPFHPRDIRDRPPLDVIETVMRENPRSMVAGCIEWENPAFARKATADICRHFGPSFSMDTSAEQISLPPLPGGAIFHLASILGLDSLSSQLIVKSRVAHHAARAKLYGASSAVCMSLVCDPSLPWQGDPDVNVRLRVVAQVVSAEDYDDVQTKKALCTAVLLRCPANLSVCDYGSLDVIMRSASFLESQSMNGDGQMRIASALDTEVEGGNNTTIGAQGTDAQHGVSRSDFLVFRAADIFSKTAQTLAGVPVVPADGSSKQLNQAFGRLRPNDRLYQHILTNYATDMHELFSALHKQLLFEEDTPVDPILHTICRLVMFWCISDSMHGNHLYRGESSEEADARAILAFGISLLLHIQDKKAGVSLVKELESTAEAEVLKMCEQVAANQSSTSYVVPDPNIVRSLIGRGYSENGARRSAIMVNNESFDTALAWAVSHSMNPNFDDPIVYLKSDNGNASPGIVNKDTVRHIQAALGAACRILEGKDHMKAYDRSLTFDVHGEQAQMSVASSAGSSFSLNKGQSFVADDTTFSAASRKEQKPAKLSVGSPNETKHKAVQNGTPPSAVAGISPSQSKKVRPSKNEAPPPPVTSTATTSAALSKVKSTRGSNGHTTAQPNVQVKPRNRGDSSARTAPPPPPRGKEKDVKKVNTSSVAPVYDAGEEGVPATIPPDADRSKLRRDGETAPKELLDQVASLGAEERQRLREEGRRLLEQSRGPAGESSAQVSTTEDGGQTSSQLYDQSLLQTNAAAPTAARNSTVETDDANQDLDADDGAWDFDEDFDI